MLQTTKFMMFSFLVHFVLEISTIFAVGWGLLQSFKIWRKIGIHKKSYIMLATWAPPPGGRGTGGRVPPPGSEFCGGCPRGNINFIDLFKDLIF